MREVPTPVWIIDRGLSGPTYLITRIPAQSALALPGLLFAALAIVLLLGGRPDMVIGVLVIGVLVTAVTALFMSRFRFLATETWVAAEYAFANRLVRLDEVVQASVSSGSYTWLKLRDARGGRISIQVGVTLPRIRSQVARGVASGHLRGMALDSRVARTLGLTITSQLDR